MKIAIPSTQGRVFPDCGQSGQFTLVDLEKSTNTVRETTTLTPSPMAPGELADWLVQQGVEWILASGLKRHDRDLLARKGIKVMVGVPSYRVEAIVARFLTGTLELGPNACQDEPKILHQLTTQQGRKQP